MECKFHAGSYSDPRVISNELQTFYEQINQAVPGAGIGAARSRPDNFHTHFRRSLCEIRWCSL